MEKPLQTLHKSLLSNNYDVPEDYNVFEQTLTAKGNEGYQNRRTLWQSLKDNNYDVPDDYETFSSTLFAPAKRAQSISAYVPPTQQKAIKPQMQAAAVQVPETEAMDDTPAGTPWGSKGSAVGQSRTYKPFTPGQVRTTDDPDAELFSTPYRPQSQLSYAQRDEIKRQNDFAVRQVQKLHRQLEEEQQRRNKPLVDTGNENVNQHIIKTQGEWEDDMQKGINDLGSKYVTPKVAEALKQADDSWFKEMESGNAAPMAPGHEIAQLTRANKAADPEKILQGLQNSLEASYRDPKMIAEIEKQANALGIPVDEYMQKMVIPSLQSQLENEFTNSQIAKYMPKNAGEYIVQGLGNSIAGMLMGIATESKTQRKLKSQAEAMTAEGLNPNYQPGTGAELARVGVTFAADAPFFGLYGKVGGQVAKNIAEREIQNLVAKGLSENAARSIVGTALENSVGSRMKNYIMQHVVSGAITMGGFNATSEGARQVRDDDYNALRLLGSTAEGAVTGSAFGATSGLTQALSQPLSGFAKIGAKVAGFGAEAETMYGTEELAKLLQGEEAFTNPYEGSIESLMKLGVMKLSSPGGIKKAIGEIAHPINSNQVQRTGMNFTPEEEAYVRSEGQSLMDALSNMHPDRAISEVNGKKKLTAEGEQMRQQLSQAYDDFMNNKDIPANVKQKVAQTLGGIYRPGLETGSDIIQNEDGSVIIKTRDKDGNCIQDIPFDSYDAAADWQQQFKSQFSRNDAANMWNNATEQQRAAIVYRVMQQNRGNASLTEEVRRMGPNANPKRLAKNLNRIMQGNERRDQQAEGRELTPEEARNYIQTVIRDGSDEVFNEVYDIMRQEAFPADELNTQRNYWEGKQLTDIEKHNAQVDAQLKEEQLMLLGEDFANEVMQAADYPDEKIAELAARRNVSGPQLKAALEYYNAISKVNGMMDETLKSIDNQVEAANAYVRKNTHPDSGSLIEVTANGRNYYVTAGHFQITPEGKLVGTDNTGMVILRDMETGEIETLNPNNVTVTAVKDPQRLIDANESMDGLRGELMQQADNTIELNPETPETPSEMGETFIGDDGKMYMVAGQPDGTGNFTWLKFEIGEDGAPVGEPQPLDINEYRKAKSNELDAISRPQEEPLVEEPVVKDNLTTETEAVPEVETPVAEAPAAPKVEPETPASEVEPEPAPQQRIPVDEKGNLLYEQAKPEDTLADLTENFGEEDAQQMIAQIAENTGRKLDELKNKDLSGITDMAKLAAYKNEVKELQRKHDYWQSLVKQPEPAAEVEPEVKVENNEQNTTGQTVDSQHTGGEATGNRDAGESQVQEPRAKEEVAADTEQPQTERHQTDTGVPPVSGADVPGGTSEVKAEEPATPQQPEQPQGKTAQQKVYEATVSNNIGKKFEFTDGTGNRNEITIDGIADDGKVQITRQSFDKQSNAVNEPQQLLVDADRIGKGLIEGTMKPAATTEDKLRTAFKGRPAMQNLINVLNEKEMSDMLDAYNDGDSERISELFGELSEAHKEDIILGERNNRNSNVDKILSGPGSREEKLRRIRKEYQGYNDAEVSLSDEALQPTTLEEYISDLHSRVPKKGEGTIAYTTYTTPDGREVVGLQGETGFGKKSGDDTKGFAPWLAKKGEGISLLQYAEGIHSQLPEAMQEQFDVQAVRNAIANMFGSAQTPSDIPLMVIRRGVMQAEQAARRVEEMIIDGGISYQKAHRNFAGRLEQAKLQTNQQPTEGQKEAGNYKKGHLSFGGYHFTIENPAGSKRRGTDANGKAWENTMHNTYGYILGKKGKDGDHLDMFINDHADLDNWSGTVYVVDQVNPKTGKFDESKVLYGFDSEAEARDAYLSNYSRGWKGLGKITGVDKATFDKWLDSSDRQNKEFAQHSIIQQKVENQVKQFDAALKDLNDREISIDNPELLKDYGLKHVTLSRSGDHVSLTHFIVDKPGQGYGTRFMEDLARLADQNGWTLTLTPDTAFGAKSLRQLQKFYKRFGFKPNKGRNTDFMTNDSMVRRPADWNPDTPEHQEQIIRDAVIEHLRENGVEVNTDWKEGQRIIDRYNGEASLNKHKVYHGTGAEFDAFDHSHMGEGEGYQTYGYGTYVTEVPAIGKGYAEKGARSKYRRMNPGYGDNEVLYKGEKIDLQTINPLKMAYDVLDSERTIKKAINTAERLKGLAEDPEMQQKWQACIDILKDSKKSDFKARKADMTNQRFVYDVEIPYDNGKNYLSWEEPYDERLTNGLMEKLGADDYAKWAEQVNRLGFNNKSSEPYSGMNAYYALSQVLGSPKRASEILSELGYVGMKYPTNYQAGGNKKGTKNYVIFNEGDAKITDTMQFFKTSDGQAYGFAYGGKIFVDPRIATAETPVHEYGHLWIQAKRASNPEEWNEIKNVMLNDPLVQPIIERVKVDYPELTKEGKEDLFAEEIITQFSGKRGNERLHEIAEEIAKEKGGVFGKAEAVAAMQRLKNILNRFWEGVAKMMGWKYRNANQIADRIMADMLNGVDPKQRAEREAQRIASQKVEEEKPIFISNAEKAVEAIKQEKATPEQWLAMIQKNGGLKAAEDKWLGLSEWLAEQNKSGKSVTKQELMDYIRQNQIKVEEEEYHDFNVEGQNKLDEFNQEFQELIAEGEEATGSIYVPDHVDWAFEQMVDRYGDDFRDAFEPQRGGDHWELIPQVGWDDEPTGAAKYYLDAGNVINSTRLDYTTNGLHNKKEIALTVPTIEPYKENDEIHFGDAGNGRAVAWIRFGETTDPDGKRVLVIDEIQSKRHQDAREKGYRKYAPSNAPALVKYETAKKAHNDYLNTLRDKYGRDDVSYGLTEEEQKESSRLWREAFDARAERNQYMRENSFGPFSNSDVPEAPFEKNWHELAMKRMLRYAAENGYDKIAWTTGNQQAERYSIGKVVEDITIEPYKAQSPTESDGRDLSVYLNDGTMYEMFVQPDGTINSDSDLFNGKKTSEVFGKDIAAKIAGADKRTFLRDADLRVGGEGMKGFYDDILPRFMNKYGKKWGVKVDNINLPQLESVAQKMHAVDVTPEMRESVMQGQPMFQKVPGTTKDKTLMGVHNISEEKLRKALKLGGLANPSMAVVDTDKGMLTNFGEISLVPASSLIAKSTGRNAGTWAADAYTPRFPTTYVRISDKNRKALDKWLDSLNMNPEMRYQLGLQFNDHYNSFSIRDNALMYAFLHEKGLSDKVDYVRHDEVSPKFLELREKYGNRIDTMMERYRNDQAFRKEVSDMILAEERANVMKSFKKEPGESFTEYKERRRKWIGAVEALYLGEDGMIPNDMADSFLMSNARKFNESGQFDGRETLWRTNNYIRENNLQNEYAKYFADKAEEFGIEEMVANGHDRNGRLKFKPIDLNEISKQMKKEGKAGGEGGLFADSPGALRAKLAPMFDTLADMRMDKNRIVSHDDFEIEKDKYNEEYFKIKDEIFGGDYEDMEKVLLSSNIEAACKRLGDDYEFSPEEIERLKVFKAATRILPTEYFETKFERPVGINEFEVAVVPENTSKQVVEALKQAGLDVRTYDDTQNDSEAKRQQAIMDAVKDRDDIMFQLVGKKGAAEADRRDEETIRMDNNRVAEEMEKAGKDASAIKLATGWERGKDGQWRYEVPDTKVNILDAYRKAEQAKSNKLNELYKAYDKLNDQYYDLAGKIPSRMDNSYTEEQKAKIRQMRKEREKLFKQMNQARDAYWDYKEDVRNVTNTTLGEILGADNELFKYYPEMKDMQVQFSTIMDPGVAGSQEAGYGIKLNADELKRFENNDDLNNDNVYGTLLHEIQHAIQETEGFAQGGNLRTATTKQGISEIISQVRRKRNRILQNIDSNRKYLSDEKELELAAMLDGRTIEKERKRLNEELDDWTLEYDQLGSYIQHLEQTGRVTLSDARDLYRRLAGEVEARNVTNRMDMTPEERQQKLAEATEDVPRDNQVVIYPDGESGNISFHKVEDADELKKLKSEPTVKRYRAMQLIDGKLYPPMSAKVDGEMRQPTEIGVWEKAEERPDLVKNGKFVLNKAQKGQGNVPAAYNPYFHTSTSGLNDQFTSAYKRPELVVVEVEIPESELTSGYKAEGAKDAVGNVDWHSGVVNGQLPADRQRQVTLSRYSKVNRVVPDSEVADMIAKQLDGTDIAVPYNVVTPSLRAELEKKGVAISDKPAGTVTKDANGNPIRLQEVEIKPVGKGDFGDIYDQFKGKPKEAIKFLMEKKNGEATGALSHKEIGDIDLVWGNEGTGKSDGYGLAKLVKYHPEVLDNLQEILDDMSVVKRTENRINLESATHQAAVRLTWNEKKKNWLLTAFEKKNSALDNTTDTDKTSDRGKRNDTATPQSTVSEGKDMKNIDSLQENNVKSDEEAPMFQREGTPEEEMTPEERQYWNKWDADMKKWRERNAIPEGVDGPGEKPRFQQGETALAFAQRLMDHNRAKALWQTAPKLEDYRQKREDKDILDAARENEQRYPDSPAAKMRRVAAELQQIRHSMSLQKAYDKATVKAVTDFAQDFMKMGFGDNLSRGEMERMLSSVKNATGARDIKREVDNILNILMDNHLRNLDQRVQKLSSVKELSKTAQGVEKQGKLELKGQRMIKAFREAREGRMDADKIRERLYEVAEKMSRNDEEAPMWEQEYEGLSIALQYQENIEASRDEWAELDREYKDAVNNYKTSGRSYKAQQELLESLDQAMMENKIERIGLFGDIIGRLEGNISESMKGAKEFVEREKQRVNRIHSLANFDLAGKPADAMRESSKGKPANFFLQPLGTFEQMLKMFGEKNAKGEGNLYDYFMRNWVDSNDKAYTNELKAKEELDAKAREVFGDKVKRWSDLYEIARKLPTAKVEVLDGETPREFTLNQGQLLYIYMADKMTDGRMKLRKMGIDEEKVQQIKEFLDPRLVQLGDWLQDDYLVQKRTEYNKVHERMFGAPMAAIDHYFPIKILGDARVQEQDVANMADQDSVLPSTITGNIIKRRKNALPLDILHTDALSLAIEHVEDMERWAATAEWNKDINTLLSYTNFRNKVKNMNTIYGSGDALWNSFADTARMAAGTYRPKAKPGSVDSAISNIAKGVTAAKINFRVYTAFKQLLSAPAFLHDVDLGNFVKDAVNPYGSWKWAMENMPIFKKRWKSRQVGDTRLMDDPTDWKLWKTNIVQMATRMGMSPNALVDGVTCAVGAKAIYESRYKKYKEIGASDEVARKRALQDAEIGYNLTQQSSEGAFVSAIQKDRTVAANMLSVFRNSSMAYTRQWVDAARNLSHRMQKGYKEDSIKFMTNQLQDQFGLDEEQAKKVAEAEYNRAGRHEVAKLLNMMFGVTMAWNLGASLPYLLMGDDDKTKKEMLTDAVVRGMLAGPTEGFAAGNLWSELMSRSVANEQFRKSLKDGWGSAVDTALDQGGDYEVNPLPLMADIQGMIKKMGYDKFAAAQDIFNICMQSAVGVNPQTFTDMFNAVMDYAAPGWDGRNYSADSENMKNAKELALFMMRLMNAPTSSWKNKYIDELGMDAEDAKKLPYDEMARRYAHYKHWKDTPALGWLRGEEGRNAKIDKLQQQFDKAVMERMERLSDEELQHNLVRSTNAEEKRKFAKLVANRLGLQPGDTSKKSEDEENWYQKYYQQQMLYDDIAEDETLATKVRELKKLNLERNKKALSEIGKRLDWIRDGKYDSKSGRPKKTENQGDQYELLELGKKQLGSDDDKRNQQIMANIRKWRKEALELAIGAEM